MRLSADSRRILESHDEMTRHAFISHMEDYMRQLVSDPLHADTDGFLKRHGIDNSVALKMLLTPSKPGEPDSAVISVTKRIKDNGTDDNGHRRPDTFSVKYGIFRKDYTDKMRKLYSGLLENKERKARKVRIRFGKNGMGLTDELFRIGKKIYGLSKKYNVYLSDSFIDTLDDVYDLMFDLYEKEAVNEGAWGYKALDNDEALDNQDEFAEEVIKNLSGKLRHGDKNDMWAWFGVFFDFLDKYKDNEIAVTDEYKEAIDACKSCCDSLLKDDEFIGSWEDGEKIRKQIEEYKTRLNNMVKDRNISEDAVSGGATSADASGQFTQPLFGKPVKRKSIYITEEQSEYLRKKLSEEAVADTAFGDFGYDAPIGDGKKNRKNSFFTDANDHKDIFKGGMEK